MGRSRRGTAARLICAGLALACFAARGAAAEALCAYRAESGAIVYTNTPGANGICASAFSAPALAPPSSGSVARYDTIVRSMSARYGVSSSLVHAVIATESAYNPGAVSAKGAQGLMQLMPQTARRYGVTDAFNASENIRGGVAHLRDLLDAFGGDTRLAVAAYNAGAGAVQKYSGIPPYKETRNYVGRVLGKMGGRSRGITRKPEEPSKTHSPVHLKTDSSGKILLEN